MSNGPGALSKDAVSAPARDPMIETVVLQPTGFCNIDCKYCYLPGRDQRGVMEQGTVRLIFERIFESGFAGPEITIIWHAGEPLAAGVAFYQQAFETIEQLRPKSVEIIHSFQTNGMLLSEAWCDLIEKWQVNVGVSIDGPKEINDANRVTRKGLGTFDSTMAGIRLLQSRDIPFHTLSVLTGKSLSDPDGMYRFFREARIQQVCFNVEESEGEHVSDLLHEADLDGIYRAFLERFWGLARADGDMGFVREIDGMIPRIVRPTGMNFRNPQTEPLAMVNIDRFGRVSTFSPELLGYKNAEYDDFIIGDVHNETLREMYERCAVSPLNLAIQAGVQRCKEECGYFTVCGGGAPVNKLYEAGSFEATKTGYCKLTQMIPTDIILDALDRLPERDLRQFAKAG